MTAHAGGLAARLVSALGLALAVLFSGILWYDYRETRTILERFLADHARAAAQSGVLRLDLAFRAIERATLTIARVLSEAPGVDDAFRASLMRSTLEENTDLSAFSLLLKNDAGNGFSHILSYGRIHGVIEPLSFSSLIDTPEERDWKAKALRIDHTQWVEPFRDLQGFGENVAIFSAPLRSGDRISGLCASHLTFEGLARFLGDICPPNAEGVFVLGSSGRTLAAYSPSQNKSIARMPASALSEIAALHDDAGILLLSADIPETIAVYNTVPTTRARYVVLYAPETILYHFGQLARFEGMLASTALLGMLGILYFVIRRHLAPLRQLTSSAKSIAHGDLRNPIVIPDQRDEIALLASTLENMRLDLLKYLRELEERAAERERIESDLRIARSIQTSLLPQASFRLGAIDGHAVSEPAREVGGDFYDYVTLGENHLLVTVGDVSGKGIPAALFVTECLTLLHAFAPECTGPGDLIGRINDALAAHNDACMFVTLCCLDIDTATGTLRYANAGHPAPLLRKRDGTVLPLPSVRGALAGVMPAVPFEEGKFSFGEGETLLLFTDGVTEAENETGAFYSESRLRGDFSSLSDNGSSSIIHSLRAMISAYVGSAAQTDDLTILALSRASEKGGIPGE